ARHIHNCAAAYRSRQGSTGSATAPRSDRRRNSDRGDGRAECLPGPSARGPLGNWLVDRARVSCDIMGYVRCRPVFAAAATFVVALTVVASITVNMGHFGEHSLPAAERTLGAQTLVLTAALLALVLSALFSERRRSEASLKQS